MIYFKRFLKFYIFISSLIYFLKCGICLPRFKRSNNDVSTVLTTSFYDKLKQSLAPVLQQPTTLNEAIPPISICDFNDKFQRKRFSIEPLKKLTKKDTNRQNDKKSLVTSTNKRNSAYLKPNKFDMNIFEPYIYNASSQAVAEHEIDYDAGDLDLPDIDEPPAHIFEYNRYNKSKSNNNRVGQEVFDPSPYYNLFRTSLQKSKNTGKPVSLYEKYKKNLSPLVNSIKINLKSPELHKNSLKRAKIDKMLAKPSSKKLQYGSLYDEFKKRLEDFSSELGIDAGLISEKQTLNIGSNKGSFSTAMDNDKDIKNHDHEHFENQTPFDFQSQQKYNHDSKIDNKLINKRSNLDDATVEQNLPNNNFGSDFDFWLQQRGFENKINPMKQHNYERYYNLKPYPDVGGYADGNCDYNDNFKYLLTNKDLKKQLNNNKRRTLRGINNMNGNYLAFKTHGTDGSNQNKFFPNVLAEPLHTGFRPPSNLSARSLLENIAHKLNISTLDVAKKVATIQDLNLSTLNKEPELHNLLQQYIENSVISAAKSAQVVGKSKVDPYIGKQSKLFKLPKFNFDDPTLTSLDPNPFEVKNHGWDPLDSLQISTLAPVTSCTSDKPKTECTPFPDAFKTTTSSSNNNGCPWEQTTRVPTPSPIELPKENMDITKPNEHTECPVTTKNTGIYKEKTVLSDEQVSKILEKLMKKIEEIQLDKIDVEHACEAETRNPLEDTPCKLAGSWLSTAMGLRFDINFKNETEYPLEREAKREDLGICVKEWIPPRAHDVINTDWPFTGSTLKETGGPFYLYTQKQSENTLATFVGFCRSCGGVDTIFGTWSFSFPSKCCQDTAVSFQTKNDVMRRYTLEEKRKDRYKNLLYRRSKFVNLMS